VPLKYSPKTYNLFFAVLILAFTNQVIPRGGEIARLGVINKYEKIPFSKLFGIALIERLTDFIILILLFIGLLVWQFDNFLKIIELPQISMQNLGIGRTLLIIGAILAGLTLLFFVLRKFNFFKKLQKKFKKVKSDIHEGFTSLYHIEHKFWYFAQSILIYAIWFAMLYVLFYAYPPTTGMSVKAAAFAFGLSTLAFLLPVQAGMGAWHFVVVQSLLIFGLATESGKVFSLMAHSATNHVYLITGAIVFALLPLVNGKSAKNKKSA
jgi:uncharacterized protein (TIRG00374 family)